MGEPAISKPLSKPSPPPAMVAAEPVSVKPLTMRGRKRHKCMVCGNIARSRCPFFSCKGCCVKAGNACQIHVLKPSLAGESAQGSSAPLPSQGPVTSTIVRHPYDSLRLRTARPSGLITRKEAGIMNSWRFCKLRAYLEGITTNEDEAFNMYMQNNLLLEELFNVSYSDNLDGPGPLLMAGCTSYERPDGGIDAATVSATLHVRQREKRRDAHKQRLKRTIDRGLQKLLNKGEETDDFNENEEIYLSGFAARRELKRMKIQSAEGRERLRRMEVFTWLIEKLKVVENQDEFDLCWRTYEDNFVNHKTLATRLESTAQTAAFEKHIALGADHTKRTESSSASDFMLNASFKPRVDSFGVMKEIWGVDTEENVYGGSISSVEML
ncbi:hypothetical protein GOP47_0016370 [Adiantum capillus-veneris]|uniref:Uncharacterized protein n=1 Tax=Adiantum capillus-veneris TaxID=13818 RepID=A0A9D4UHQ0_ADICA|nr:hypothetical protein GOP47_0016370 [Adiantum capillus-veneris]